MECTYILALAGHSHLQQQRCRDPDNGEEQFVGNGDFDHRDERDAGHGIGDPSVEIGKGGWGKQQPSQAELHQPAGGNEEHKHPRQRKVVGDLFAMGVF